EFVAGREYTVTLNKGPIGTLGLSLDAPLEFSFARPPRVIDIEPLQPPSGTAAADAPRGTVVRLDSPVDPIAFTSFVTLTVIAWRPAAIPTRVLPQPEPTAEVEAAEEQEDPPFGSPRVIAARLEAQACPGDLDGHCVLVEPARP